MFITEGSWSCATNRDTSSNATTPKAHPIYRRRHALDLKQRSRIADLIRAQKSRQRTVQKQSRTADTVTLAKPPVASHPASHEMGISPLTVRPFLHTSRSSREEWASIPDNSLLCVHWWSHNKLLNYFPFTCRSDIAMFPAGLLRTVAQLNALASYVYASY